MLSRSGCPGQIRVAHAGLTRGCNYPVCVWAEEPGYLYFCTIGNVLFSHLPVSAGFSLQSAAYFVPRRLFFFRFLMGVNIFEFSKANL